MYNLQDDGEVLRNRYNKVGYGIGYFVRVSKVFGCMLAKSDSIGAKKNETDITFSDNIYDEYIIINYLSKDSHEILFDYMI